MTPRDWLKEFNQRCHEARQAQAHLAELQPPSGDALEQDLPELLAVRAELGIEAGALTDTQFRTASEKHQVSFPNSAMSQPLVQFLRASEQSLLDRGRRRNPAILLASEFGTKTIKAMQPIALFGEVWMVPLDCLAEKRPASMVHPFYCHIRREDCFQAEVPMLVLGRATGRLHRQWPPQSDGRPDGCPEWFLTDSVAELTQQFRDMQRVFEADTLAREEEKNRQEQEQKKDLLKKLARALGE